MRVKKVSMKMSKKKILKEMMTIEFAPSTIQILSLRTSDDIIHNLIRLDYIQVFYSFQIIIINLNKSFYYYNSNLLFIYYYLIQKGFWGFRVFIPNMFESFVAPKNCNKRFKHIWDAYIMKRNKLVLGFTWRNIKEYINIYMIY